jgi:hypothetical protein
MAAEASKLAIFRISGDAIAAAMSSIFGILISQNYGLDC